MEFPQVGVINDKPRKSPWVSAMDQDLPVGQMVLITRITTLDNFDVQCAECGWWFVHPSNVDLLGPL